MSRSRIIRLDNLQQFTAINVLSDPGHISGPVVIPGVMEIRLTWSLTDGKAAFNVLHARYTAGFPGNVAMANALATGIGNAYTADIALHQASTGGFTGVQLRDIGLPDQPLIASTTGGILGTSTGTALPDEMAAVITLRSANTGPSARGRIYIPNWATTALGAGGVIVAGAVTGLGSFGAAIRSQINATPPLTMVIALPARAAYTGSTGTAHPARPAGSLDVQTTLVLYQHSRN